MQTNYFRFISGFIEIEPLLCTYFFVVSVPCVPSSETNAGTFIQCTMKNLLAKVLLIQLKQVRFSFSSTLSYVFCIGSSKDHTDEVDEELSDVFIHPWAPG